MLNTEQTKKILSNNIPVFMRINNVENKNGIYEITNISSSKNYEFIHLYRKTQDIKITHYNEHVLTVCADKNQLIFASTNIIELLQKEDIVNGKFYNKLNNYDTNTITILTKEQIEENSSIFKLSTIC